MTADNPPPQPAATRGEGVSVPPTVGLVLAGGLARRMGGGDKAQIKIGGVAILDRVLARLKLHCKEVILNANGDPARFERFGLPVIPDEVPDFAGPLAGVLAGIEWVATNRPGIEWLVTAPADCPFLPDDLVTRLHQAAHDQGRRLACARSGEWRHPVVGIWPVVLAADLRHALIDEGLHKIEAWTARHGVAIADWPVVPVDPFFNVNTSDDVSAAERIAADYRL